MSAWKSKLGAGSNAPVNIGALFESGETGFTKGIKKGFFKSLMPPIMGAMNQLGDSVNKQWSKINKSAWGKKAKKFGDRGARFGKAIGAIGHLGLSVFGIFLQLADAMGILTPIMSLLTAIFMIMGGAAMQVLGPAIADLADVLFSEESMGLWKQLGTVIGHFVANILNKIGMLLSDPEFIDKLSGFIENIGGILYVFLVIFGGLMDFLGGLDVHQLGLLFYILAVGIAFLVGVMYGGIAGVILGAIFAGIAAIALSPLLFLAEGGIVTRPTIALIGESGPEAVIPLNNSQNAAAIGGYGQENVWATEDNGTKLDMIYSELRRARRLR